MGSDKYGLLYPVLFPSENTAGNYKLRVSVTDTQENTTTVEESFFYDPPRVSLIDGSSSIVLPSISQNLLRPSGAKPIQSKELTVNDGNVLSGS